MADFRTDLVNELRNQKYYLEQDFVRLVNSPAESYQGRLKEIKEIFVEIGKINTALALTEVYLPQQQTEPEATSSPAAAPAPAPSETDGDVVTAQAPQPLVGQTHAE